MPCSEKIPDLDAGELEEAVLTLAQDHDDLLHGRCHLFALALHTATGWPLKAWMDVDDAINRPCLVHAFVVPQGVDDATCWAVDVRGLRDAHDLLDEFETFDPWLESVRAEQLLQLGEGRKRRTPEVRARIDALAPLVARLLPLVHAQIAVENLERRVGPEIENVKAGLPPESTLEWRLRPDGIDLLVLRVTPTGQGFGSKALHSIVEMADRHGLRITGCVDPTDDPEDPDTDQLMAWYACFGFRVVGQHPESEQPLIERAPNAVVQPRKAPGRR